MGPRLLQTLNSDKNPHLEWQAILYVWVHTQLQQKPLVTEWLGKYSPTCYWQLKDKNYWFLGSGEQSCLPHIGDNCMLPSEFHVVASLMLWSMDHSYCFRHLNCQQQPQHLWLVLDLLSLWCGEPVFAIQSFLGISSLKIMSDVSVVFCHWRSWVELAIESKGAAIYTPDIVTHGRCSWDLHGCWWFMRVSQYIHVVGLPDWGFGGECKISGCVGQKHSSLGHSARVPGN